MIKVTPHLDFGGLVRAFLESADTLRLSSSGRQVSPIPFPVVVPSLPFADALQKVLAEEKRICMGWDFLMPQDFIHRVLASTRLTTGTSVEEPPTRGRAGESLWSKNHLVWAILPLVDNFAPRMQVQAETPADRFALAGALADRLDQYGHFRPEMIRAWQKGASFLATQKPGDAEGKTQEAWQKELWQEVAAHIGEPHPALQIEAWFSAIDLPHLWQAFPYRSVVVLCSGAIDPLLVEVLQRFATAGGTVQVEALLPTYAYLEDLRTKNTLPQEECDPEELDGEGRNALVVSMARNAIGAFHLLGKLDPDYAQWPDISEVAEIAKGSAKAGSDSLLQKIQRSIREFQPVPSCLRPGDGAIPEVFFDGSLRVHDCHSARREVEVLRDEILRALWEWPDLRLEDIHIVTSNPEIYGPLVEAIFGGAEGGPIPGGPGNAGSPSLDVPRLPVRLVESSAAATATSVAYEGLVALLEMARRGRVTASEVLAFYRTRTMTEALSSEDRLETLERWIKESGLTHGLERTEVGSLPRARERLIAGGWLAEEDRAKYPGAGHGEFVLPVGDALRSEPQLRAEFLESLQCLETTLRKWMHEKAPAAVWAERLQEAARALLKLPDEDQLKLRPSWEFLGQVNCPVEIDVATVAEWFAGEVAERGRRSRAEGKIACGSLRNLQNLPCRVLAVVGMDAMFPGQNRTPSWDLLRSAPRMWDRNARTDDRQLFLDALLAPRDLLLITATRKNVRTGQELPRSACVEELLRSLGDTGKPKKGTPSDGGGSGTCVVEHPLQPFQAGYFEQPVPTLDAAEKPDQSSHPGNLPPSFSQIYCEAAKAMRSEEKTPIPFLHGLPKISEDDLVSVLPGSRHLTLADLGRFWKDPGKVFLRAQQFAIPRDDEADEALDRSPIALDSLQEWTLKDVLLWEQLSEEPEWEYRQARLAAQRDLPPGFLGAEAWQKAHETIEALINKMSSRPQAVELETTVSIPRVGEVRVSGRLWQIEEKGWVYFRAGKIDTARHFLEPWFQALLAACVAQGATIRLIGENGEKNLVLPDPTEAPATLTECVRGYLLGHLRPVCFDPIVSEKFLVSPAAGAEAWNHEPFMGGAAPKDSPTNRIIWRDTDAFSEAFLPDWEHWAQHVSAKMEASMEGGQQKKATK